MIIQGEAERRSGIRYEVDMSLPPLGEGGMGQVRRGVRVVERSGLRQDVAIKFLYEDLPESAIDRARREASIQIHNENLVEMFGFIETVDGTHTKRYHVVSELLEGVMLFDLLCGRTCDKSGKEIEYAGELYAMYQNDRVGFARLMALGILSGLMALHDKGYIHRDLDPSNIMVTADRKIKIIDYGIAKQLDNLNTQDRQLTSTGQFVGKAAYAAPELVLGDVHSQDKTTDIYAVGIMLYQFVTGRLPFDGTMAELIDKQVHARVPLKGVPYKRLRNIIDKATQKKQRDRYQSAAEMRVDVEHLTQADKVPSRDMVDILADMWAGHKGVCLAAAVACVVTVTVVMAVMVMPHESGPSEEELAQMRMDSIYNARQGMVTDDERTEEVRDEESGAMMKPVGMLTAQAVQQLGDSLTAERGLEMLREIAVQYGDYKHSARAMALLAALLQPLDASVSAQNVKEARRNTAAIARRDSVSAHAYAQRAVDNNGECYEALFELGTDLMTGMPRTGVEKADGDNERARELFERGLQLAEQRGDEEYAALLRTRIEQLKEAMDE